MRNTFILLLNEALANDELAAPKPVTAEIEVSFVWPTVRSCSLQLSDALVASLMWSMGEFT